MNKHITRKFHTQNNQRTRSVVNYTSEKVFSTRPFISFEKAKKMIVEWGYNLEEVLCHHDKQGRLFTTDFNQHQMIFLKNLELASKSLHLIKSQVKTVFRNKTSQLYFTVEVNERQLKQDKIHWEIQGIFNSNSQLTQFAY